MQVLKKARALSPLELDLQATVSDVDPGNWILVLCRNG